MKIEILTREMSKKPVILTFLANRPDVRSSGAVVELSDLRLEISDTYLLFLIRSWERADQIVSRLFSIRPNIYSPTYYEPYSEQKILVTAQAKPLLDIIPELSSIEHLNLEQGELAGNFEVKWKSRDVAVLARCFLMVEGEVAVCKVKFEIVNRETEYYSKECIENILFHDILTPFCADFIKAGGPLTFGPSVEAAGTVNLQKCSEFINRHKNGNVKACINFNAESDEIKLVFTEYDYITLKEQTGQCSFKVSIADPQILIPTLLTSMYEILNITFFELRAKVQNVTFDPNELVEKLGFQKDCEFYNFSTSSDFTAVYNIKLRLLLLETKINFSNFELNNNQDIERLIISIKAIHSHMQNFLNRVRCYAI